MVDVQKWTKAALPMIFHLNTLLNLVRHWLLVLGGARGTEVLAYVEMCNA